MRASDVMTFGAASISSTAPIEVAPRLLVRCRISALPAVDGNGNLICMITGRDLLRPREGASSQNRQKWQEFLLGSRNRDDRTGSARLLCIADVMTSDVLIDSQDPPNVETATMMGRRGVKRIPVVKEGKTRGIVRRAGFLRGLAREAEEMPSESVEFRELRQRVILAPSQKAQTGWRSMNVAVRGGSVVLRGALTDKDAAARLISAARGVAGVKQVEDRLIIIGRRRHESSGPCPTQH